MKKIYLLLVMLSISLTTTAQLGVIVGGHTSKTTRDLSFLASTPTPFQWGFTGGLSYDIKINNKLPIQTRLLYVYKPDQTYESPLNFVNFAVLLNPKLGKLLCLNVGPVIEYDTEKHGIAKQMFFSGLIGVGFLPSEQTTLNIDYQTNINNPGGSSAYKIRSQTLFITLKIKLKK